VIVDLAVEQGGNCKLSKPGKVVRHKGVALIGHQNVPGRLAGNASELYARNILNFIDAFFDKEKKQLALDWEDEIVQGIGLTRAGEIVHEALAPPAKAAPTKQKTAAKPRAKAATTKRKTAAKASPAKTTAKKAAPRKRAAKGA
jgi:NAD(P) transhydrogenase subunit alpha